MVALSAGVAMAQPAFAAGSCPGLELSSGGSQSYAVLQSGAALGWGFNDNQVISRGVPAGDEIEVPVPQGLEGVVQIRYPGVALRDDGRVLAWGWDPVGTGIPGDSQVPTEVPGLDGVVKVLGSVRVKLVLRQDGTIWAWGSTTSTYCEFADPGLDRLELPTQITNLTDVVGLDRAGGTSFAVLADGSVWNWGRNLYGEMGRGTVGGSYCDPAPIPGLVDVVAMAASWDAAFFLKRDGTVWSCGRNWDGALGDGTESDRESPVQMVGLDSIVAIRGGFRAGRAMRADGTFWAWGWNDEDQLGIGLGHEKVLAPRQVPVSQPVIDAASGSWHSVIVLADGTIQASGYNAQPWNNYAEPETILGPGSVRMLHGSTLVRGDGSLWAWGPNRHGSIGDGSSIERTAPVMVMASGVKSAASGGWFYNSDSFRGAVKEDGTLWTWGSNTWGQLGDGTRTHSPVPKLNPFLGNVQAIAFGTRHGLALTASGTVEAWGENEWGQLGNGTTLDSDAPVPVAGLAGVVEIAAGGSASAARLSDGTIWTWGANNAGQLGYGGTPNQWPYPRPGRVAGVTDAVAIRMTAATGLALTRDGQVWTWGASGRQQANTAVPAPMPEAANPARLVESGNGPAAVILRDGRVLAWGYNRYRQIPLGPGAPESVALATEVPALAGAAMVAFGTEAGHAAYPDGSIRGWGTNKFGAVGNGRMGKSGHFVDFLVGTDVVPTASEGNVLRAVKSGVDVRLSYAGSAALIRGIYRDVDKAAIASTRLPPVTDAPSVDDRGVIGGPERYYYAVRALSPCSHTPGP